MASRVRSSSREPKPKAPSATSRVAERAPYAYAVPADLGDGWRTASLASVGLDPAPLRALADGIVRERPTTRHAPSIQSISIARHGKLVFDEYFFGFDANRPHDVRSAGKSVTTLMLGRAIEDGAPLTPQSKVYPLFQRYAPFANPDPRKAQMTIADLMTMSSGYACDDDDDDSPGNEDTMQSQTKQPNWYKFTLDLPDGERARNRRNLLHRRHQSSGRNHRAKSRTYRWSITSTTSSQTQCSSATTTCC